MELHHHAGRLGVTLTERREVNGSTTKIASILVDKLFGGVSFETELKLGMAETLGKIRRATESVSPRLIRRDSPTLPCQFPLSFSISSGRSATESMTWSG